MNVQKLKRMAWGHFESLEGEETPCFNGDLFLNGKKYAHVRNSGTGGSCVVEWEPGLRDEGETILHEYMDTLEEPEVHGIKLSWDIDFLLMTWACAEREKRRGKHGR